MGLRCIIPPRYLRQLKTRARTLPSLIYFSCVIYRVPPKSKYQSSISGQLKVYFGGSKERGPLRMRYWKWRHRKRPWPEMTSHEVTWPEVMSYPEVCSAHSRKCIPALFFLTIVVVQNVPLLMTGSSMANGCDVTESDITGIDATGIRRLKVGDSPWRAIVFVRGV